MIVNKKKRWQTDLHFHFNSLAQMFASCRQKQSMLIERFASCTGDQERYAMIINMGRSLPKLAEEFLTEKNLVPGCQSRTYLYGSNDEGQLRFQAQSDALISAGLTALLLFVYNEETPKTLLTCPPDFLKTLEMTRYLTPSRSNGLHSVHLHMKRYAMRCLMSDSQLKD